MKYFAAFATEREPTLSEQQRASHEQLPFTRGLRWRWREFEHLTVLTAWRDPGVEPVLTAAGPYIGIGVVRIDNRVELMRLAGTDMHELNDLELVVRLVAQRGYQCVRNILGDFAFMVWNRETHRAVAAGDALGVRKLYYARTNDFIAVASRAEALQRDSEYEVQYLAQYVARCTPSCGLTPYAGVNRIPAGTTALLDRGRVSLRQYWAPEEVAPTTFSASLQRDGPPLLRDLLATSIEARVDRDGPTWSQLSGGLDSSSIVSTARWLVDQGRLPQSLAGTVSYVDSQGTAADERSYSGLVAAHCQVPNHVVIDPPFWLDEAFSPPYLDLPGDELAFYPRERRMSQMVLDSGARVLLSGSGSDELLTGTTLFLADWVAQGHWCRAVNEAARWAIVGRVSFWEFGWANAVRPLIPRALRRPGTIDEGRLLPWISSGADRRYNLSEATFSVAGSGRFGHKYHDAVLAGVRAIMTHHSAGVIDDFLDVRHPFLSRPLVEFALSLPPELCARPRARKWILREAMRGIVPEKVRLRVGKGTSADILERSLSNQRTLLQQLVEEAILVELGVVDGVKLREAFDASLAISGGGEVLRSDLQSTLMVEAWLRMRCHRWPPGQYVARSAYLRSHDGTPQSSFTRRTQEEL